MTKVGKEFESSLVFFKCVGFPFRDQGLDIHVFGNIIVQKRTGMHGIGR